ncbi:MAG: hypothetical protein WCV90_00215 [Candidatus Woesearchaeota archaeon]
MALNREEFRKLILETGENPSNFSLPELVRNPTYNSIQRVRNSLALGLSCNIVIYDPLLNSASEVVEDITTNVSDLFEVIKSFSHQDTVGKTVLETDIPWRTPGGMRTTNGLVDHLFCAEETNYDVPSLFIYHSFDEFVEMRTKAMKKEEISPEHEGIRQAKSIHSYLDQGAGRGGWGEFSTLYHRLPKLRGSDSIVKTILLLSLDEVAANDFSNINHQRGRVRGNSSTYYLKK